MDEIMIKIDNVSKQYRLGEIGGTTLRDELQRLSARMRGREDPTKRIGAKEGKKGETFMALEGITFEVKKGERVGIIGHNGAGKSTLLKLLSRVTAPTAGSIGLNGRIASMLEVGTGFHPELTGRENIYMNGAILGMTKKEIDDKIEDIIDFSECRRFIDTPVKRYSSGMYVKLAFSVAAHLDSEIMIMDEVLAVGDMAFQQKCLTKMNDVSKQQGRTILYVSHNMNTIRQLCDRVVVLDHGKVVFDGGVEKGIEVYFNFTVNDNAQIDYSSVPRLPWLHHTVVMTQFAGFVGKTNNVFKKDEPLIIYLKWKNEQEVDRLSLRVEILHLDRTPIGTAFLYDFYQGHIDEEGSCKLKLKLPALVAGKYTMNYTFFQYNDFGVTKDVDCVHGLSFILESKEKVRWNRKNWGDVVFKEIEIEEVGDAF